MNLKTQASGLNLCCYEMLKKKWTIREATNEEILKIKPVLYEITSPISDGICVAGGYAAWVEGVTNYYDDIDIFLETHEYVTDENTPYNSKKHIVRVVDYEPHFQLIYCNFKDWIAPDKSTNKMRFIKNLLRSFDIDLCRVAYYFDEEKDKVMYIRHFSEYLTYKVLKMCPIRMHKYNRRSNSVISLKWLALTKTLKVYNRYDVEEFINKISIMF